MEQRSFGLGQAGTITDSQAMVVNTFMRRVYNWMAAGLGLSALAAYLMLSSEALFSYFINPESGPTGLFWVAIVAELGMVIAFSAGIRRLSVGAAAALFIAYSTLNGLTLAPLLAIYTQASIFKAFLITAGTFGAASVWSSTTKKDLSSWGSFLFMGLIGIIIASLVNLFLGSAMVDWIISYVGVGLFIGLTAYDTQMLRNMVLEAANEVTVSKMALFGALKLYLDFINLFIMLLRIFGDRR